MEERWACGECGHRNVHRYHQWNCGRCDRFNPDVIDHPLFKSLTCPPEPLSARMTIDELLQYYASALQESSNKVPSEINSIIVSFLVLPIGIGSLVDVKDKLDKWYAGVVLDIKDNTCLIHFAAWKRKWDEWVPMNCERIRAPMTRTHYNTYHRPGVIPQNWFDHVEDQGFDKKKLRNCMLSVGLSNLSGAIWYRGISRYFHMYGIPEEYKLKVLPELMRS